MPANMLLFDMQAATISRFRRKNGLYSYKLGRADQHKNPHPIALKTKEFLKKQGYQGQLKIAERERISDRPFGRLTSKGKFRFNLQAVPFYHVPDLTDFKLKPYVPHITPKIDAAKKVTPQVILTADLLKDINQ